MDEENSVVANDDGSVTVTLKYPLEVEGEKRSALTLKRLKGRQIRKLDLKALTRGDHMLDLIAQLTGVAPPYLGELDAADFAVLSEVITGFFGSSRATGERS
jgi:hypothetical protein